MLLKYLTGTYVKQLLQIKRLANIHTTTAVLSSRNVYTNLTFHHVQSTGIFYIQKQTKSTYKFDPQTVHNAEERDMQIVNLQFPQPKNVLHSYYDVVANQLESKEYKINPIFKMTPTNKKEKILSWTCTYNIKWPEERKFQVTSTTKQDASTKAASKVLMYLKQTGKILDNGTPLIYDRNAAQMVIKDSTFTLKLNEKQEKNLNSICDIFNTDLAAQVLNVDENKECEDEIQIGSKLDLNLIDPWENNYKKLSEKQLEMYKAKETVELPIQNHKQEFEQLLTDNRVVIIRGEPGCGKSTRIPQYVLEHWANTMGEKPANIVVTQPRRIAAISLAERVAHERAEKVGNIVGFQVRLKSAFNPKSGRILYCTTGILLRQLQSDPGLRHCTHIILDEAHERDVNTDLLMNLTRRAMNLNPNLKVIVMSATIDAGLFLNYFENSPVMNVPGFTHPVKVNFLDDMEMNLCRTRGTWAASEPPLNLEDCASLIRWIHTNRPEGAILCFLPGWEEITRLKRMLSQYLDIETVMPVAIHSKLSHEDQKKIFSHPPPGIRKIILSTNIAETSVTVDDVVYVIDTGIQKESRFDPDRGIMCLDNHWISQSSMNQRKGRAGRVKPGESFHLYPKAKYDLMQKHSIPEILRVSLTKIVLDAKVYSNNQNSKDFFSHLPSPPSDETVLQAVNELKELEMLDENENLTPLGRAVSYFQLPPKLSKAMVHSIIYKCVCPIIDIATLFSSDLNMFSNVLTEKIKIKATKMKFSNDSDHIALMILFEQWVNHMENEDFHEAATHCTKNNLIPQRLDTIKQLRELHYDYLEKNLYNVLALSDVYSINKEIIKGVLLSGVGTVLVHRNWDFVRGRMKKTSVFLTRDKHRANLTSDSVNHKKTKYESPFLVYINQMRSEARHTTLIRETSMLNPLTFVLFNNSNIRLSEIKDKSTSAGLTDPVLIQFEGAKLVILSEREHAQLLQKSKDTLKQMESYFIYQLTKGGETNRDIVQKWDQILSLLNDVLR